jgi:hypothetical protein
MSHLNEKNRATLTVDETATILGISRTTVYESVRARSQRVDSVDASSYSATNSNDSSLPRRGSRARA